MPSRRSTLRAAVALGFGGLAASGTAATEPTPPRHRSGAVPVSGGDTTVFGRIDPEIVSKTGVPEPLSTPFADLRERHASISLDDVDRVTASAGVGADRVEGRAVATGAFDADALDAELKRTGFTAARTTKRGSSAEYLRGTEAPIAISVSASTLRLGYGPTTDRAAGLLANADERDRASPEYGSLPSLLDGEAVTYADLGESGRRRLTASLSGAPDGIRAVVEASSAVGAALRLDGETAQIRYGAVVDPGRLSMDAVADVLTGIDELESSVAEVSVSRRGRTVLADAVVDAPSLWESHADLLDPAAE